MLHGFGMSSPPRHVTPHPTIKKRARIRSNPRATATLRETPLLNAANSLANRNLAAGSYLAAGIREMQNGAAGGMHGHVLMASLGNVGRDLVSAGGQLHQHPGAFAMYRYRMPFAGDAHGLVAQILAVLAGKFDVEWISAPTRIFAHVGGRTGTNRLDPIHHHWLIPLQCRGLSPARRGEQKRGKKNCGFVSEFHGLTLLTVAPAEAGGTPC